MGSHSGAAGLLQKRGFEKVRGCGWHYGVARSKFAGDKKMSEDNIENQNPFCKLILERIFLKDASFESPSSPSIFESVWKPDLKVDINTKEVL